MKGLYLILLLSLIGGEYTQFIELFPQAKLDRNGNFLTRSLNWNNYADLKEKYPIVSEDNSFIFLCDQDSSKLYYEYDLYHMEEGYLIEHVKENFVHHAIASFRRKEYDMVIYSKYGPDDEHYYLRSFDKKGNPLDELMVNKKMYEGTSVALDTFSFSLINSNNLKVYSYQDSTSYNNVARGSIINAKVLMRINSKKRDIEISHKFIFG